MDYLKKLKEAVEKKYSELQTYSTNYNLRAKSQREQLMNEHKEAFKNNPESIDVKAIAKDMFYLNGFYQTDIRKLQVQLLEFYALVKDIAPELEFGTEIETTIIALKGSLPGQLFVVVDGEFQEIEKGQIEKLSKDYEDRGYYKMFESQIEQINQILNA